MKTKHKILIVDDEALTRERLGDLFTKRGLDIVFASNGKEAVDICTADQTIDIVSMDCNMPVMDGYTATKKIKKIRPNLIIIAVTGNKDIEKRYKKTGFDDYFKKPVTWDGLWALIKNKLSNL